jgi:23S rRNA pseudouridine2605 synthase
VRLQKLLAAAGFGSRRDMEGLVEEGRVTVNGRVASLGDRADPLVDDVRLDGERLVPERPVYWLVHKPRGVITTMRDEEGRRTVLDLLPPTVGRVFPVGRLDRETSGLLLLTNDGDTAHALLHPSLGNEREYRVRVKGRIDDRAVARLEKGVALEEGRTAPGRVSQLHFDPDDGSTTFSLTLVEGRKRQIRRSLLLLGFPVRRLSRIRMGPLRLGRLRVGEARPLRAEERRSLARHVERLRSARTRTGSEEDSPTRGARAQRRARSRKGVSR